MNQEWNSDLAKLALKFVGSHVPGKESAKWWLTERRLLQHAARCSHALINRMVTGDGIEWALHSLGDLYAEQGKLDDAEKMYQRALQGKEKVWGPDHTSTLDIVINSGILYKSQGKLDEAEKMYQRALQGKEKAWGSDHIHTGHGQQLGRSLRGPGQAGRGQGDVPAGTARMREGMGPRSYINT